MSHLCPTNVLLVSFMCPTCVFRCPTCILHVTHFCTTCILHMTHFCTTCVFLCPAYVLFVSFICPTCVQLMFYLCNVLLECDIHDKTYILSWQLRTEQLISQIRLLDRFAFKNNYFCSNLQFNKLDPKTTLVTPSSSFADVIRRRQ